jgi:hypothetical protein
MILRRLAFAVRRLLTPALERAVTLRAGGCDNFLLESLEFLVFTFGAETLQRSHQQLVPVYREAMFHQQEGA